MSKPQKLINDHKNNRYDNFLILIIKLLILELILLYFWSLDLIFKIFLSYN